MAILRWMAAAALALALTAAGGAPASAQGTGPVSAQTVDRIALLQSSNERILGALMSVVGDPRFPLGASPEEFIAGVEVLAPEIAAARAAIVAEAEHLRTFPDAGQSDPFAEVVNGMRGQLLTLADGSVAMLDELGVSADAMREGDWDAADASAGRLTRSLSLLTESQRVGLRGRQALVDRGSSTWHQIEAVICSSVGWEAYTSAYIGEMPVEAAAGAIREQVTCMRTAVLEGRKASDAELERLSTLASAEFVEQMRGWRHDMSSLLSDAADDLDRLASDLEAGIDLFEIERRHGLAQAELDEGLLILNRQAVSLLEQLVP